MWKLTIEDDQANKTLVHLVREDYGLGRAEENAIRLTERNISRQHARLERVDGRWVLKDVTSYNGCYVNGQRVAEAQELSHGDLLQVGDYRLLFEDEAISSLRDATATVPALRDGSSTTHQNRWVMLVGPSPGAEFVLGKDRMVIGRGEECDISINHPSVSRVHAELYPLEDGRYELCDKNSANGVRVNGVELPRSFVDARDVVELGDVILKFIPAGETYTLGSDESLQIAAVGAARRSEADEGNASPLATPLALKVGLGVGVTLIALALVVAVAGRSAQPSALVTVRDESTQQAQLVLSQAKQLLTKGDVQAAYRRAGELPADSSARASTDFRSIQSAYADHLFARAKATTDTAEKRALYDQIARTPSVDTVRRRVALDELSALSAAAVNVADLPRMKEPAAAPPRTASLPETSAAMAAPSPRPAVAKPEAARPLAPGKPLPAKPSGPATLVRENPFESAP